MDNYFIIMGYLPFPIDYGEINGDIHDSPMISPLISPSSSYLHCLPRSESSQEDLVLIRVACLMRIHPEVLGGFAKRDVANCHNL